MRESYPTLKLQREEDNFLVKSFVSAKYTISELQQINGLRMFLQVITLSDITPGNGPFITYFVCNRWRDRTRRTIYEYLRQGRPLDVELTLFKRAIKR